MEQSPRPSRSWLDAVLAVARLLREVHARILQRARPRAADVAALRAEVDRLRSENDLLRSRLQRFAPANRPRYSPFERLRILWHRARFGLSMREAARTFLVSVESLRAWVRRIIPLPEGAASKTGRPRLADVVGHLVKLLRWDNAAWGTRRIAQVLARLGIKVSRRSVQRLVRAKPPRPRPAPDTPKQRRAPPRAKKRAVRAKRPHHVWLVDLTVVKLLFGLIQVRIAAVLDAFTRRIAAIDVCGTEPDAGWVVSLVGRAIRTAGRAPKRLVTDKGPQFTSEQFRQAVKHRGIRQRFGAIGRHGSCALIERFWRTLKCEAIPLWSCFLPQEALLARVERWCRWANAERTHQGIAGLTPNEKGRRRRAPRRVIDLRSPTRWKLECSPFEGDPALPVYRLRKAG